MRRLLFGALVVAVATTLSAGAAAGRTRKPAATPRPAVAPCVGDCDLNSGIDVGEVVRCVGMAIGEAATPCARCDADGDFVVSINEVIGSVSGLLNGCTHDDAFEPDNSFAQAGRIACGELQIRDLTLSGDRDWVRPEVPDGQLGTLETVSVGRGEWDTTMAGHSANGALRAYDDDGGEGEFSRLDFGCSPSTDALVAARITPDEAEVGTYGLRLICRPCATATPTVTATPTLAADRFEPDDSPDQAAPIACGELQTRTAPLGDVDWLSLTLPFPSTLHLHLFAWRGSAEGALFDDALQPVANRHDDERFECGRNALPAGTYRLRVTGSFAFASVYDVGVLCTPCARLDPTVTPTFTPMPTPTAVAPDAYEPDDRHRAAPIACGQGLIRSLSSFDDSDWLRLQVAERSAVLIQAQSPFALPFLALQNAAGADIALGYSVIQRDCAAALDAGDYFVEAYHGGALFPYDVWVSCMSCDAAPGPTPSVAARTPTPTSPPRDAYEPDGSPDLAREIACGALQVRSLDSGQDEDWATFTLAEPSAIAAMTSPDLLLELFDGAGGRSIARGRGSLDRLCGEAALAPGRYALRVPSTSIAVPSYDLSLLCQPCVATPTPTATRTPRPTRTPGGSSDGMRVFTVDPGVLLTEPSQRGSGLFTTALSGASAANGPQDGFSGGPLRLIAGLPDATGVAALWLAEDATLRIGLVDGTYACLALEARDSEGSIDCDGGTPYGTAGTQPAGNVGAPFMFHTGLGPPLGAGHANLLVRGRYRVVPFGSPDYGRACSAITYHDPDQFFPFTTATARAEKGVYLVLAVDGQPFDCAAFDLPCSGGALVAPMPGTMAPIGDVANAIRIAEGGCANEQRAR